MAVRSRLIARKRGENHSSRGTDSRAYCSVKGVASSEPKAINASRPAAIARA
jgi:hypothetical protein